MFTRKLMLLVHTLFLTVDGCYSSKFLRSSARRFLLEMFERHEIHIAMCLRVLRDALVSQV